MKIQPVKPKQTATRHIMWVDEKACKEQFIEPSDK